MSTITKERVAGIASGEKCYTHDDVVELARIALASLEAEAVAYMVGTKLLENMTQAIAYKADTALQIKPLYTAPPAPVSVPDAATAIRACMEEFPESVHDIVEECAAIAENACRAAMLQGADGNSQVIADGWVACSELMPEREVDVQVYCSDKKEQMVGYMERNERYGYFRFASLPNGGGVYCQPTHWMPLPAAPQQGAKNV